jgi:broad specificity phosphatase PhoE
MVGDLVTRVYLVRHGQTEWNKNLTFRGRLDIPLNDRGHREAEAIAEALKDKSIGAIYTSPLRRSTDTARPAARFFNLEIVPVQGKRPDLVRFPKGETLDEVRERSFCAMRAIVGENPGKSILIIPHRVINKVLLCAILGLSNSHFWEIRQDTGCVNLIECYHGGFVLSMMNDICHLREIADETVQPDF